jgi:type I restriction enzyme S subunit
LPDIKTQSSIARILSSLDDKIELNNKINKELDKLARTIYGYWFVQNASKMWKRKKIEYLVKKYTDNSLRIDAKNILKVGKYPVITQDVGDLVKGYTNEENPIVDLPAIIFGDHSCTLRYVNFPFFRGADGTQLLYFDNEETTIYAYFCLEKLIPNLPNFGKYERHFKYLKDFEIAVPPTQTIEIFNKIVSPIFKQIVKNRQQSTNLAQLRDFLLPLLMNGQVKIREDNKKSPKNKDGLNHG